MVLTPAEVFAATNQSNFQFPFTILLAPGIVVVAAIATLRKRKGAIKPVKSQLSYCANCRAKLTADTEFCGERVHHVEVAS